jgi:hypothetical protein
MSKQFNQWIKVLKIYLVFKNHRVFIEKIRDQLVKKNKVLSKFKNLITFIKIHYREFKAKGRNKKALR